MLAARVELSEAPPMCGICCKVRRLFVLNKYPLQAENPDNQIKKGQSVVLTCEVLVEGVRRKDIVWLKDGKKVTEGISKNK